MTLILISGEMKQGTLYVYVYEKSGGVDKRVLVPYSDSYFVHVEARYSLFLWSLKEA